MQNPSVKIRCFGLWQVSPHVEQVFFGVWSERSMVLKDLLLWILLVTCKLTYHIVTIVSPFRHRCDIAPACRCMISQRCQNHPNLSTIFLHDIFDGIRKISFWHWNEHDFYYHLITSYCNLRSVHVVYIPVQIINEWLFKVLPWISRPYPRNDSNWSCRRKFQTFLLNNIFS